MPDHVEKQAIEEMYKDVYKAISRNSVIDLIHGGFIGINTDGLTRELYDDGYRKQEWIGVEERLPKKGEYVLCLYPHKDYGSKVVVDCAETDDGFFSQQFMFGKPSHWMPLPEPPSAMKGE